MSDIKDAPKPASTVLIVRDAQSPQKGLQVLMVRRSAGMAFGAINGALVSLWEKNLLAVRAEAEYGFLVNDVDAFVTYINAA